MLGKLRISAHKLAMEGGRNINIPKYERICTACDSGEIEDEEHFLPTCSPHSHYDSICIATSIGLFVTSCIGRNHLC